MEKRIRESFNKKDFMHLLGAKIILVEKGKVIIECPYKPELTQQNGYFHAGVMTSIVDSACGYAAYTMMSDTADILTVEVQDQFFKTREMR